MSLAINFNDLPPELTTMAIAKTGPVAITRFARSQKYIGNLVERYIDRNGLHLPNFRVVFAVNSREEVVMRVESFPRKRGVKKYTVTDDEFAAKFGDVFRKAYFGLLSVTDTALPAASHFYDWLLAQPTNFDKLLFSYRVDDPVKFRKLSYRLEQLMEKYNPKQTILSLDRLVSISSNGRFNKESTVLNFIHPQNFLDCVYDCAFPTRAVINCEKAVHHDSLLHRFWRSVDKLVQQKHTEILLRVKTNVNSFFGMKDWTLQYPDFMKHSEESDEHNDVYSKVLEENVTIYIFYYVRTISSKHRIMGDRFYCILRACTVQSLEEVSYHREQHLEDCQSATI